MLFSLLKGEITQEEYLRMNNITLIFRKLPGYLYGFIYKHFNETLITINDQLSYEKTTLTILHEFAHFELHHTELEMLQYKVDDIEDEADRYVKFLLEERNEFYGMPKMW